jgi:hypothetical protein
LFFDVASLTFSCTPPRLFSYVEDSGFSLQTVSHMSWLGIEEAASYIEATSDA